ncbi:MAG: hypothetical protein PHD48_07285 [Alphaproteobacteria bacterium]|nr:hypothetical protein [Alphaproteobacteria bacterium]
MTEGQQQPASNNTEAPKAQNASATLPVAAKEAPQAKGIAAETIDEIRQIREAAKDVLDEAKSTLTATKQSITSRNKGIEVLQSQAEQKLKTLEDFSAQIDDRLKKVDTSIEQINLSAGEIEKTKNDAVSHEKTTKEVSDAANDALTNIQNAQKDIDDKSSIISNKLTEITRKETEIDDKHKAINDLHSLLLEDEKDEEGKIIEECYETQIDQFKTTIEGYEKDLNASSTQAKKDWENIKASIEAERANQKEAFIKDQEELLDSTKQTFIDLKKTLEKDIRSLLPEAGAAGLASTYSNAKARYSFIPYKPSSETTRLAAIIGFITHLLQGTIPNLFFYAMFLAPIGFIIYYFTPLLNALQEGKNIEPTVLVFKTILSVPLGVVSFFGWSSVSLNRRLYEEYNHKQRVMQLYQSFKDEIETLEDNEAARQELIEIMLTAVKENPSTKMSKYGGSVKIDTSDLNPIGLFNRKGETATTGNTE